MPFEGAGAISDWSLTLPKTLRVFDYTTISDVIVHIDYTADHHAANNINRLREPSATERTPRRTALLHQLLDNLKGMPIGVFVCPDRDSPIRASCQRSRG